MEARRRALGRGLGALIPAADYSSPTQRDGDETVVPIEAISPNPQQPRTNFSDETLAELAESIREMGLLQPLLVRPLDGGYQLIAGERRLRAAQRAGLTKVPIVVRQADHCQALELALIENLQREDLNPLEEARAYERLVEDFGSTQEQIAQRVGKSRSAVANSLRLLQLPEEIRAQIAAGQLSAGHARSLLALPAEQRLDAAQDVVGRKLSVRTTERLVRNRTRSVASTDERAVETELSHALGTKVRLRAKKNGAGRIEIDYYSLDELDGLIARLTGVARSAQAF